MLRRGGLVVGLAVGLTCCVHYVERAERAYGDGRYLEAAEDLAAHEQELAQLTPARRAQYGMYRGLSLLELGEIAGAERWLRYSEEVEDQAPGSLTPLQQAKLRRGLAQLDELTDAPRSAPPSQVPPPPRVPVPAPGGGAAADDGP